MIRSILAFCLATAISLPAFAATQNAPRGIAPALAAKAARGTVLLIYSPSFGGVILNKGVASVTELATGIFCVATTKPLATGALPVVGVEWGNSSGNSLLAFYENGTFDCPAGQIEVRTFDFNAGGAPVASDEVAFTVFVE